MNSCAWLLNGQVEDSTTGDFLNHLSVQSMGLHHPWPLVIEDWFLCNRTKNRARGFEPSTNSTTGWIIYHVYSTTGSIIYHVYSITGWIIYHAFQNSYSCNNSKNNLNCNNEKPYVVQNGINSDVALLVVLMVLFCNILIFRIIQWISELNWVKFTWIVFWTSVAFWIEIIYLCLVVHSFYANMSLMSVCHFSKPVECTIIEQPLQRFRKIFLFNNNKYSKLRSK